MYKVCIDTGGTFTDCVLLDRNGNLSEFKSPSTPPDFSQGVMDVLEEAASANSKDIEQFLRETEFIVHGTTAATNALVTRNVARTAMITTEGFRDILEMRRSLKIETHSMYEAFIPPYEPIVPRYLRFVVQEKLGKINRTPTQAGGATLAVLPRRWWYCALGGARETWTIAGKLSQLYFQPFNLRLLKLRPFRHSFK